MKHDLEVASNNRRIKLYIWKDYPYVSAIVDDAGAAARVAEDVFRAALDRSLFRLFILIPSREGMVLGAVIKSIEKCEYLNKFCDITLETQVNRNEYLLGAKQYAGAGALFAEHPDALSAFVIAVCLNRESQARRLGLITDSD